MAFESVTDELSRRCSAATFTRITSVLLESYRGGHLVPIRELAGALPGQVQDPDAESSRVFAHLMLLYHPDRTKRWEKEIERAKAAGDEPALKGILRIFTAFDDVFGSGRGDRSRQSPHVRDDDFDEGDWPEEEQTHGSEDFDDTRTTEWAWPGEGSSYEDAADLEEEGDLPEADGLDADSIPRRTLFEAVYAREYGHLDTDFQPRHLESFEGEMNLSDYEITDLDGASHLVHIRVLQLSENRIRNLSPLASLRLLEELYLASNRLEELDGLENLASLRVLDVQNNLLTDIEPILDLPLLEFVNVIGNPIPAAQIQVLRRRGVIVLNQEGRPPRSLPFLD